MAAFVFDTNVYVSGILFDGPPRRCLEVAIEGKISLCASRAILDEIESVLLRPKFAIEAERVRLIVSEIEAMAKLVHPSRRVTGACRDEKDHIILECALAAKAAIVTGDDDLLSMGSYRGAAILSCRDFLAGLE